MSNSFTQHQRNSLARDLQLPVQAYGQYMERCLCGENLGLLLRSLAPADVRAVHKRLSTNNENLPLAFLSRPSKSAFQVDGYIVEVNINDPWGLEFCGVWDRAQEDMRGWMRKSPRKHLRDETEAPVLSRDHPWYAEVIQWCKEFAHFQDRVKNFQSVVLFATDRINTPGQWIRMWPEVVPYLPTESKQIIHDSQRASRLPADTSWVTSVDLKDAARLLSECKLAMGDALSTTAYMKIIRRPEED